MKNVLVTGGTGTFGRAFVPHVTRYADVDRVVVLSRDEFKQAEMESELKDKLPALAYRKLRFFIGDVRDVARLELAMHNVTHVVHAAALKRIEKCEADPIEAVKTNVEGTTNVIRAALSAGVHNIVGLSTDKAVNPINLYGATKFTMERLMMAANNVAGGRAKFSVVRYGNIFNSRGSVVTIWRKALAEGKPVLVTETAATRYFMRIDEAVRLVERQLRAVDPEPLKLPFGLRAYRLWDLAFAIGAPHMKEIGLSPFEKLHEEMGDGTTSETVTRMSIEQLKEELSRL